MKAFTLVVFFFSFSAMADLDTILKLSEDVRDSVVEMEDLDEQEEFVLTEEKADTIYNLQKLDLETSEIVATRGPVAHADSPCFENGLISSEIAERIEGRKFKIYFTGTFSDGSDLGLNPGFSGKYNYSKYMNALRANGAPTGAINTIGKLENKYLSENPRDDWQNLSTVERGNILQAFATERAGEDVSVGLILSEYAIREMTRDPGNWKSSLNEIKDHLSFEEKLKIASHFGGRFSDNYNTDRANGEGDRADGIVTIEEMLESVRDNEPGGVCRDVSQAQSLMLQELGVGKDDIYQVSYRTATGGHVTTVVRDPDDSKRIVKINYDYMESTDDRNGGAALTRNDTMPEFGMNYRIYDADGKPASYVPTEFGDVLKDVTGGRSLKDGLTQNHSLQRVYVETPIGVGTAFTGTTSSGDNIVGVAISKRSQERRPNGLEYGVAIAKRDGQRSDVKVSETALYGTLKYTYNSPRIEKGPFSLGMHGGIQGDIIVGQNRNEYSWGSVREGVNTDVMTTTFVGVNADYESRDGRTRVDTDITLDGFVSHKNEQEGPDSGFTIAPNQITWSTAVQHEVSDDMLVMGESAILLREMGNSAVFKAGLLDQSRDLAGTISYQTPLDDVPSFMPVSSEAVGFGVVKRFEKPGRRVNGSFELGYERDLDYDQNQVKANFGFKW